MAGNPRSGLIKLRGFKILRQSRTLFRTTLELRVQAGSASVANSMLLKDIETPVAAPAMEIVGALRVVVKITIDNDIADIR